MKTTTTDGELVSLMAHALERHRTRPVFAVEQNGKWTQVRYGDIAEQAARLRTALARLGVKAGDRVAVVSSNRPEWLTVLVATHALGAVIVPMYEVQHESDWRHILRDAGARVCFASTDAVHTKLRGLLGDLPDLAHLVAFERDARDDSSFAHLLATSTPARAVATLPAPGDLAAIIYTSGTTGSPKGVELSHRAFAFEATSMADEWDMGPGDRSVSILPWAHVGGFCEVVFGVQRGMCMALLPAIDKLRDAILQTRPTVLIAVPRVWNVLYDAIHKAMADQPPAVRWLFRTGVAAEKKRRAGVPLRKRERVARRLAHRALFPKIRARLGGALRIGATGAAALSKEVAEFFECVGIQMYEVYGQTETCAVSTANRPGAVRLGSVGKALDGVRIEIDTSVGDAEGAGEIVIHTPAAMHGYRGLDAETAAVLQKDGGIRTGDLGRVDGDGFVYITGRVREVYKLENGKFVSPVPLEESITLSPYVSQAFVWGLNKPHNVALLVADLVALKRWCEEERIPSHDPARLLGEARVRDLFARELTLRTEGCKGYERVVAFALIDEPFTTDSGLLTPTLKVKRNAVLAKHRARIDALYR